jgi:hypothetical protein
MEVMREFFNKDEFEMVDFLPATYLHPVSAIVKCFTPTV